MARITIAMGKVALVAELADTPTARRIAEALPLEGKASLWGEEIYFMIPLELELEPDARADVEVGELGYWPSGPAFCVFFGPTPMSTGPKPRAASAVNVFGHVIGDCSALKDVTGGAKIRVESHSSNGP